MTIEEDQIRARLIDRARKVLELSKASRNDNERERLVALDKIHTMLTEHNLVMEDITQSTDPMIVDQMHATRCESWRRRVGTSVGALYFCVYFYTDKPKPGKKGGMIDVHYLVGERHDTAVAHMMFDYICEAIESLASEAALKQKHKARKQFRETFIEACSVRVCQRIQERVEQARRGDARDWTGENLPVLASEYDRKLIAAKNFMSQKFDMTQAEKRQDVVRADQLAGLNGTHEGVIAGNKIGLDTQVTGDMQKRIR